MSGLYSIYETIRDFLDEGGGILVLIAWVTFVMWALIIERLLYLRMTHPHRVRKAFAELNGGDHPDEWSYEAIRTGTISRLGEQLESGMSMIRTLAAICPLLGLLGTVTGMIVIFDVMSVMGSSSPRSVAAGVAQATLTTMAGMVAALSGFFPAALLARSASDDIRRLEHDQEAVIRVPTRWLRPLGAGVRVMIAGLLAFFVTMGLIYGMQRLIETGEKVLTDPLRSYRFEFVRVKREETVETKAPKPQRVAAPEAAPPAQLAPDTTDSAEGGVAIPVNFSDRDANLAMDLGLRIAGASGFTMQDADYQPLVKVAPIYPNRATVLGLSGWVLVRFTITTTGAVRDIEIVESSDPIFERAAVQAAAKFKYKPRVLDGVPIEVTGVQHYIQFRIEQ